MLSVAILALCYRKSKIMEYLAMKLERKGQLSIIKAFFFFFGTCWNERFKTKGKAEFLLCLEYTSRESDLETFCSSHLFNSLDRFFFFLFSYMSWRTSSYLVFTNLRFPVFFLLLFSTITSFLLSPFVFAPFSVFLRENKNSLAS